MVPKVSSMKKPSLTRVEGQKKRTGNSAEVPGLQFRTYSIEAKQKINVNPKDSNQAADAQPATTQEFEVKGPRFALPENAIYSFYPP